MNSGKETIVLLIFFIAFCSNSVLLSNAWKVFPWRSHDGHRHHSVPMRPPHHKQQMNESWEEESSEKKENGPIIRLSGGAIRGRISYAGGKHKPALIFEGIPFAEPPTGSLRFAPLREKERWHGVWDATKYKHACLSNTTSTRSPQHYISEDCIYVNVFTDPKCLRGKKRCPVLFYIHGGGFVYDSATMFNETQIVQKYASDGIVFVIPAYRIGVFGLLDLGNDRTVKRNLAMHDIIFSLEWVHKEIHNFGGDAERITAMGNSAGATALTYLCGSPAVREDLYKQAIISSGVPFFLKNMNLKQSFELLEHFNCTRNNNTKRLLSDREKVECLRRVDSKELLRQQQTNEQRNITFQGPGTDTEILPFANFAHLLRHWKPRPMIYSTTIFEFNRWSNDSLKKECLKPLGIFGYTSKQAFNACFERYEDEFYKKPAMRTSYESMHSESFITSLVNTRLGSVSYVGEFGVDRYTNHSDDLRFFFGLHQVPLNTTNLKLMDAYYPKMIKNFINGHAPDKKWRPQTWNGRNYFRIVFNITSNGTVFEIPHGVNGYQDIKGLDFWLHDLAIVERNARKLEENKGNSSSANATSPQLLESNEEENNTWLDLFGKLQPEMESNLSAETAMQNFLIAIGSSFVANTNDTADDETTSAGSTNFNKNDSKESEEKTTLFSAFERDNEQKNAKKLPAIYSKKASFPIEKSSGELRKVWSAFWVLMCITGLLTISLVMLATAKLAYRYKDVRSGYTPVPEGLGYFTEKTRIVTAKGQQNSNRYL